MDQLISNLGIILNATLMYTPPLLYAALGSCFSEKSGVVNIGIEGMIVFGGFMGALVGNFVANPWICFLCGGLRRGRPQGAQRCRSADGGLPRRGDHVRGRADGGPALGHAV